MDDQFLHRLRREPPASFAARLKWQLDRPARLPRSRARLLLLFAIFGTAIAFALVSAPARRVIGELFDTPVPAARQSARDEREIKAAPAVSATDMPDDFGRPPAAPVARHESPVSPAPVPAPQPLPSERSVDPSPVALETQSPAGTFVVPTTAITQYVGGPTPQMQANAALETRRALFRVLSVVMRPLDSMRVGNAPLDLQVAKLSAYRLNRLSSMIPEVFGKDTRAFELNTRARDLIWMQGEDFASRAEALMLAADALERAIDSQDETAAVRAIGTIEAACTTCHNSYRKN